MNASTWKKAADIVAKTTSVTPQASATATTESHNLQSLQLSTLSMILQDITSVKHILNRQSTTTYTLHVT